MLAIDLSGKSIIVTGAAKGIGEATAVTLAEAGAKVAVVDIDETGIKGTAEEINKKGGIAWAIRTDVTDIDQINRMVEKVIQKFGAVDVLVNSAAIIIPRVPFYEIDLNDWDKIYKVDVKGVFLCCRAVAPHMMERKKGKIINIGSVAGKIPRLNMAAYCSAKAAVIHFSKVLALELAPYNINVIAHCPGTTGTDMVLDTLTGGDPEKLQQWLDGIPLGRLAKPEDQANLIAFLASDLANHITGQAINVDGGQVMW